MAIIGRVLKQPDEKFALTADFADELVDSDTISTAATKTTNISVTPAVDSSAAIKDGAHTISGTKVTQKVQAGADGETHRLEFEITTSLGRKYETEIDIFVKEI